MHGEFFSFRVVFFYLVSLIFWNFFYPKTRVNVAHIQLR